jgi:aminoglycoside phosphotransferase (APT) family kinase protein
VKEIPITRKMLREVEAEVPETLEGALDPAWLSQALAHLSDGAPVSRVELADIVKAMASKVRIAVVFENAPDTIYRLCLKGFLDHDLGAGAGGVSTLRESDFYARIAPNISMLTPPCAAIVTDRRAYRCILIMEDMIAAGVHFYSALEPLSVDQTAETLDQLARLHARPELLAANPWLPCRLEELTTRKPHISWERIQELMHDERRGELPDATVDATLLKRGLQALAERNQRLPQSVLHGDCHPGNVYRTADNRLGFTDWQLVQRGHWALDVAYHIGSVLPVEVAEREERALLQHYLDALRGHGSEAPAFDAAWLEYRCAPVYGYYHWAITQRVDPPITRQAFQRLGAAVTRHESYKLLGLL